MNGVSPHASELGLDPARLARIGDVLRTRYVEPGHVTGCHVTVARGGTTAFEASYGMRDRERAVPMGDDTIFRIYSMSKPITSIALMALWETGEFQLDDPVARWFPSWSDHRVWVGGAGAGMVTEPARRPISVRDLLSHTSGITYGGLLPGWGDWHPVDAVYKELEVRKPGKAQTLPEFMDLLGRVPLRFQPGTAYQYSLSTDACGALVERISGEPLDVHLQRTVLGPLGMVDTAFQVAEEKAHRFAANYLVVDGEVQLLDDPQRSPFLRTPKFLMGGGGLTGTVADYVRFCEMLRRGGELDGHRIVGPRTLELMRANHLPGGRDLAACDVDLQGEYNSAGVGFGLGFASTIDPVRAGRPNRGDFYWGGAASTVFWVDPVEDLTVVFMTQLMPSSTHDFRGDLRNLVYSALVD